MKLTILILAASAMLLSSCAMSTPLQKAMGQRMAQSAMFGAALGAPASSQASSGFESFYH
jgi:hypothetical protein